MSFGFALLPKLNTANFKILSVVACAAFSTVNAQQIAPSLVWEQLYDEAGCSFASVLQTEDGGYILGGRVYEISSGIRQNDCMLVKVDESGTVQWRRTFGGLGTETIRMVRQTADGGYVFAASSSSPPSDTKEAPHLGLEDAWIVKVDREGSKQWDRTFGGSGNDSAFSVWEEADGYILAGSSPGASGGGRYWLNKLDAQGEKEWERSLGEESDHFSFSIIQTTDGGYALAGGSGTAGERGFGGFDGWLLKVDADGNKQWEQFFGGTEEELFLSVDQSVDGGFVVGGRSSSPPSGNKESRHIGAFDYWIVKVDAAGHKEWDRSFGSATVSVEEVRVVRKTKDQGYIFGAYAGGLSRVIKLNQEGYQMWDQPLGPANKSHIVEVNDLQQTKDGGYILAGSFDIPNALPSSGCWGSWAGMLDDVLTRFSDVVSWEADIGVVLESVDDLNGEWEADQSEVRTIGDANTIAFTPTAESRYYRLRGSSDLLSFGTLLSWPASINHTLEFSSNNGATWTAFAGDQATIGTTNYAIIPQSMKDHDFRTRKTN